MIHVTEALCSSSHVQLISVSDEYSTLQSDWLFRRYTNLSLASRTRAKVVIKTTASTRLHYWVLIYCQYKWSDRDGRASTQPSQPAPVGSNSNHRPTSKNSISSSSDASSSQPVICATLLFSLPTSPPTHVVQLSCHSFDFRALRCHSFTLIHFLSSFAFFFVLLILVPIFTYFPSFLPSPKPDISSPVHLNIRP